MELGRLGAGLARVPAHDTAKGALGHGAGPYDTADWAATIRRWAHGRLSERACWASRRWRWGAERWGAGGCARGVRHCTCDTTTLAYDTAGPLPRTWACLLGLLGACASVLAFWTVFRLDDMFESPFGPGSWTLFMNTIHHKIFRNFLKLKLIKNKKKNQIKFDKNFRKMKISKIKFYGSKRFKLWINCPTLLHKCRNLIYTLVIVFD